MVGIVSMSVSLPSSSLHELMAHMCFTMLAAFNFLNWTPFYILNEQSYAVNLKYTLNRIIKDAGRSQSAHK